MAGTFIFVTLLSLKKMCLAAFHHEYLIFYFDLVIFHFLHALYSEILSYSNTDLVIWSGLLGHAIPTHYSGDLQE